MSTVRRLHLLPALALAAGARGVVVPVDPALRSAALRTEISRHDDRYFRFAAPEISDATYDRLVAEFCALESSNGPLSDSDVCGLPLSAQLGIGDDRSGVAPTHRHDVPMLSLEKCHTEAELRAFYARLTDLMGRPDVTCTVEPKYDGVAISATYDHGEFVRAVTRGNGWEGDDVSAHVLAIPGMPRRLNFALPNGESIAIPGHLEVRGEIYLPRAEFERLNEEREDAGRAPYAHPRNLAAGTLKQANPSLVTERGLAAVFYGWGDWEPADGRVGTQQDFHRQVRRWGLPAVETFEPVNSADEMWDAVQAFGRGRGEFPAPTDGVVVKLDAVRERDEAGATNKAPRWAMAFKFPADQVETTLKAVTWQVGRSGVLTPVAEIFPVQLGGTTVARVSLHSAAEVLRRDLRIGDRLRVEKSGDVIPNLAAVIRTGTASEGERCLPPTHCPSCTQELAGGIGDATLRCINRACPAQVCRRIQHFISEAGVAIPGLGPVAIAALVANGTLATIPDLYRLERDDVTADIPGLSTDKACERLLAAIERSKRTSLWRILNGLGIPQIGAAAAREIARQCPDLPAFADLIVKGGRGWAERFGGLRAAAREAMTEYFSDDTNRSVVTDLVALGVGVAGPSVAGNVAERLPRDGSDAPEPASCSVEPAAASPERSAPWLFW